MSTWARRLRDQRALIGYLFLLAITIIALQIHHAREDARIVDVQRAACENDALVIANQELVLGSLIDLRIAALASPYLRLEAQRELGALQRALRDVEKRRNPCELLSD